MNKSSAKFASWGVRVSHGHESNYSYEDKKTQKTVTVYKFECRLVGSDSTKYVQAVVKGSKNNAAEAKKKFSDGSAWDLSKVAFEQISGRNVEAAFIGAPLKISVDLSQSCVKPLDDKTVEKQLAEAAVPPCSVAETSKISSTRRTDLLASLTKVGTARTTKSGDVVDVTLMDGSEDDPGTYAQVSVSLWGGTEKQRKATVGQPLVFLNLVCKVDGVGSQQTKVFNHWHEAMLAKAPACEKVDGLQKHFADFSGASNTKMLTTPFQSKASVDVSGPQPLTVCAFLDFTSDNPDANMPKVMQGNIVNLQEPSGSVVAEGSDRIWFVTKMGDASGSADVGVSEKAALQLTGLDRDAFKEAHSQDTLQFPLFCNVRLNRTTTLGGKNVPLETSTEVKASQPSASQPGVSAKKVFVNHVIQDVTPIDWSAKVAPSAAYENILTTLNSSPHHGERILFGFLSDIAADPHYGFQMAFPNGPTLKGPTAAVLIAATKKSKTPEPMGQGFKMVTPDVRDAANPSTGDGSDPDGAYAVTGFCTLDDMSKFELSPPRGQAQRYAIAFISRCDEISNTSASQPGAKNLQMDKLQILEQVEGPQAIESFRRLRRLTMRINPSNSQERKRNLDMKAHVDEPNKKCKNLRAVPTDDSLGEPEPTAPAA